ncbi:MAG: EF-P beta-lysylation protein EpmB [Pontibacterium sp.]
MTSPLHLPDSWQSLLSHTINSPEALIDYLQLPNTLLDDIKAGHRSFATRAPKPYLDRIEKGNLRDPLLLQILPLATENAVVDGFVSDPLEELSTNPHQGIIHKYQGRVLLIMSGACAINCRYCFRRHFPYEDNQLGQAAWAQMLDYIRADSSISEVILSGGDPLAVSDKRLAKLVADVEAIPHVQRLRIHTRLPVVIPQRVTQPLLDTLANNRLSVVMVLHINHPNEIDEHVGAALNRLADTGVSLLNQAVLLKDINDNADILCTLSETLLRWRVLPYYLFLLDRVAGAAHFDVCEAKAQDLVAEVQARLPGYLVPRLAREIPDRPSKTLLMPKARTNS